MMHERLARLPRRSYRRELKGRSHILAMDGGAGDAPLAVRPSATPRRMGAARPPGHVAARIVRRAILLAALVLSVAVMAGPLLWMLLSSFEPDTETAAYPPTLWPQHWTLDNYNNLLTLTQFGRWFLNSAIASVVSTALVVVLATMAAYAMSRFRFPGAELVGRAALLSYMVPPILLVLPIALLVSAVHLANSLGTIAIIYAATLLAFGLWLLRSYFQGVEVETEHAALIDGATRFQAFYKVVVPQVVPGIISTTIFTFNAAWSEYLFASILLNSGSKMTLSPGISTFISQTSVYSWGVLMAAGVLMTIPVILIFIFFQRYLIAGWSSGAIKG